MQPGVYEIGGNRYLVRDGRVRMLRRNGTASRYILARVQGAGLEVTGNGRGHEAAVQALASGQARQVEVHCRHAGCGRVLTDEDSRAAGLGPEHRGQAVKVVA